MKLTVETWNEGDNLNRDHIRKVAGSLLASPQVARMRLTGSLSIVRAIPDRQLAIESTWPVGVPHCVGIVTIEVCNCKTPAPVVSSPIDTVETCRNCGEIIRK